MDDGFDAMARARKRKGADFEILDMTALPASGRGSPYDLIGTALRVSYCDVEGDYTNRWIKVLEVDQRAGLIKAYCWVRRQARTFTIANIREIADANGECRDASEVLKAFGLRPPQKKPTRQKARIAHTAMPATRPVTALPFPDRGQPVNDGHGPRKENAEINPGMSRDQKRGCVFLVVIAALIGLSIYKVL